MSDKAPPRAVPAKKKSTKGASATGRGAKKSVTKKVKKKTGGSARPPKAAKVTTKAKTAKKTAKKKTARPAKKTAAAKARPARKAPARRAAAKTKPKRSAKRGKRRPTLNLRSFRTQLERLHGELMLTYMNVKGDSRSRESDGTEDYIDYAVSSYDREFLLSLTELERGRLSQVDDALKRIAQGHYGSCTQCGRVIPTKRLEVQPWARYCVRCQELVDSGLHAEGEPFPVADDDDLPGDDADDSETDDEDGVEEESQLISG